MQAPNIKNLQGASKTFLVNSVLTKIIVSKIETAIMKRISVKAAGVISFATLTPKAKEPATKPENASIARCPRSSFFEIYINIYSFKDT